MLPIFLHFTCACLYFFLVLECKNKWKNIRDAYVKFLHAVKEESATGKKVKKRYKYADKMKFLDRCIQHRNPPGTLSSTRSRRDSTPQHNSVSMVVDYLDESAIVQEDEVRSHTKNSDLVLPSKSNQDIAREDLGEERYGKACKLDTDKHSDVSHPATVINEQDDSKLFCLSLISTLKRLDSRKRQLAKIRIQNVLYEIEFNEPSDS